MSFLIETNTEDWQSVRPELTNGVSGKLLRDDATKIVLTRVEPGGIFKSHYDDYAHSFHFLSGCGVVQIEEDRIEVGPGICVKIEAGELHGYENNGEENLIFISVNLPVD